MIDFHTHTQPSEAAAREFFGWLGRADFPTQGTLDERLEQMRALGVTRTLIVPWLPAQDLVDRAVAAGQTRPAAIEAVTAKWWALNDWAAGSAARLPDRLSCLVGFDPVIMDHAAIETEVARRLAQGACGLKIAPAFLNAPPSDALVGIVWDLARRHGVFVLSACNAHGALGHRPWGHPRYFEAVARAYPDVNILLAHLGRGAEDEMARLTRTFSNIYTDLSARLNGLGTTGHWSAAEATAVIRDIGIDRVVYGTNYPIVDVFAFAEAFRSLDLTDDERERIGWRNAQKLLDSNRANS